MKKLKVAFFQRRPRPNFNYSMEAIFADVRARLSDRIEATVHLCKEYNDGAKSKITNIVEAKARQGSEVNHITGEVHFLNLLMDSNRVLLTIHDCRFMQRKAGSKVQSLIMNYLYLKWPVAKSRYVTTVSETTKKDIIKYTGCSPEKILVIPVAVSQDYQPATKEFNSTKPNILHIGTGDNKNIPRLAEALAGINCQLTIIGRLKPEQIELLKKHNISYTNKFGLSQNEMVDAYRQCDIVSFVSTFEGFGMPIIEANATERVVITSNCSSMPEVAGNAALLVDPFEVSSIRSGIIELIEDPSLRKTLIENGRQNRERFSPDAIATQYYDLYKKIAVSN